LLGISVLLATAITFPTLNKNCEMQNAQELNTRANIICIKKSWFTQAVQIDKLNTEAAVLICKATYRVVVLSG